MTEYAEYQGVLFDRYEWNGGFRPTEKSVVKAQSARRRELKRGSAKLVKFD